MTTKTQMRSLVRLAKRAAATQRVANLAGNAWVEAFREAYGHDDISDALVEVIDYIGDPSLITAEFIEQNSGPGQS